MMFPAISLCLLAACGEPAASPAPSILITPDLAEPAPVEVSGWEGFWPWSTVEQAWLAQRGLPFSAASIQAASSRVAKLVIASGEKEAPEVELQRLHGQYCVDEGARAWNEDRCAGLEARVCDQGICSYQHFGNCSGLLAGDGWFITAAHCTAGLESSLELATASAVLVPGEDGAPAGRWKLLSITAGKHDWDHHWVGIEDEDPVDVAAVRVDDGGLAPVPRASLPTVGEPLFILGYPRVEGRSAEALEAGGYALVAGTPSVSFGRMADDNPGDVPLCNVDGNQEHWALRGPCPEGVVGEGDERTWTGPISASPFLATYDSCNGYSGAPIFDAQGRWVGVNYTLASDTNPQEAFVDHARMVATPVGRALERLGVNLD
jgi:hypothetical protein